MGCECKDKFGTERPFCICGRREKEENKNFSLDKIWESLQHLTYTVDSLSHKLEKRLHEEYLEGWKSGFMAAFDASCKKKVN